MTAEKYCVGFGKIPGIGRVRLDRLANHFGDLGKAWHASEPELRAAGIDERSIRSILSHRPLIDLDAEMNALYRMGIRAITPNHQEFPARLREIYDTPPLLYVRGTILPEDDWNLAVVGTRRATAYGKEATQNLVSELARAGLTIVSGLARGIDTIAHHAALQAGGRTIAVCGCGLDTIYPSENKQLAEEIIRNGAMISEYPPGTSPKAQHFPRRNRILSGMSLGVLVVESMENGGALITANMALEQNREVFAVPGSIFSAASHGTNALIQAGAKAVTGISDILEELNFTVRSQQIELPVIETPKPENKFEAAILEHLNQGSLHIDELCRCSTLPAATISSTLTIMELKGMVKHLGNMNYEAAMSAGRN